MVHTESRGIGHSATKTTGAESAPLARKADGATVPTLLAPDAQKAVGQNAAAEIGRELVAHEGRQLAAFCLDLSQELEPMRLQGLVEQRRFRLPARVLRRAMRWLVVA